MTDRITTDSQTVKCPWPIEQMADNPVTSFEMAEFYLKLAQCEEDPDSVAFGLDNLAKLYKSERREQIMAQAMAGAGLRYPAADKLKPAEGIEWFDAADLQRTKSAKKLKEIGRKNAEADVIKFRAKDAEQAKVRLARNAAADKAAASQAKAKASNGAAQPGAQPGATSTPKTNSDIPGFSNDWCDVTKVPRRRWLYGQHYVRGIVTASVADGGVGKSTLSIAEGICMASGKALLGFPVTEKTKVWYWNGEEPRVEIARRVHAMCQHYEIDPYSIAEAFHFTSGLDEFPIKIVTAKKGIAVINGDLADKIVAFIQANDIGVMFVDALIACHNVSENDPVAMDIVVKTWGRIAALTNCAIELEHHTRKAVRGDSGGNFASDSRGTGATMDAVRGSRVLNQMTEKEAGEFDVGDRFDYFRVNRGKVNMVRRGGGTWYKLVSVDIGNRDPNDPLGDGDDVQTVERWSPPDVFDDVTTAHMHAVRAKVAADDYMRDYRTKDKWIGAAIAEVVELDPETQRPQIEKIIKNFLKLGVLKAVPRLNKNRKPRLHIIVGDWEAPE